MILFHKDQIDVNMVNTIFKEEYIYIYTYVLYIIYLCLVKKSLNFKNWLNIMAFKSAFLFSDLLLI